MPYQAKGSRHTAAASKACVHGQIVVENKFVGTAFKSAQVDRWTRPGTAVGRAQHIPAGQEFEIQLGGIHEAPRSGTLAALNVGDPVWINPTDNSLQATAGAAASGWIPVGIVTEIDLLRDPDVLRINSEALNWFDRTL